MTRSDFQQLAEVRIDEAGVLLAAGKWDGAYYLAGYAVECALKACIAKLTKAEDFPPKEAKDYYIHELPKLLKPAGLDRVLEAATDVRANPSADTQLGTNWDVVKQWNEKARYARKPETQARELYNAITEPKHGVLEWIKQHW